ncbi:MAG TPA: site-specific DNA-methyltransferase [Alteromonas macleodii]|nr:DNA methyltransferase [Alteromonas macleodii]HCY28151.1 site-specific DNA-methyltransferase [Alteromonas macleodii]
MSRLTDLIARAKAKDPQMGADLEREFKALSSRRSFGLNFERHRPETVELPNRQVRKGDKVRVLPPRGETKKGDQRLWQVKSIRKDSGNWLASLLELYAAKPELQEVLVEDLVVVAEFRDKIYPGLISTGKVERGGDKPFHSVINGENFHALKALTYTHRGKIDAIYIDPPYNTGAKDWKYNNDYVESEDLYRHSKWLAFLERRLRIARELLNPENSVLIVSIDDKEYARLALLLEQIFPEAKIEMITSVINPRGKYRKGEFARCEEYIFFVMFGDAVVQGEPDEDFSEGSSISWRTLRRSDITSARGTKKGGTAQFYPIYIDSEGKIKEIGAPLPHDVNRDAAPKIDNCVAVFPMRDDGTEMNWGLTASSLKVLLNEGYVRVGRATPNKPQKYEMSYLTSGRIADIQSGKAKVIGRNKDGSVIAKYIISKEKMPLSTWNKPSHNAEVCGTEILKLLLGRKSFPFPKSLYAVEDCLSFFIKDKANATVLDFFSGSGTTAHAVMRLNKRDDGRRVCISVTNNEVSADEQEQLRKEGLRPGDASWERLGICDFVTKPRVKSAITGKTPDGNCVDGTYKFNDEFKISDGLNENAEFFTLTYESPITVSHNLAFEHISPLLWLRAGSIGDRIVSVPTCGWQVVEAYGVLIDLDKASAFSKDIKQMKTCKLAYIVTNDDRRFQAVARSLPEGVEPVRLYESYLNNFQFANGE